MNIYHYSEVHIGPIGSQFSHALSNTEDFNEELRYHALPIGNLDIKLIGSRSIKVIKLTTKDENYCMVSYGKYFPGNEAPEETQHPYDHDLNEHRIYFRAFIIAISESWLLQLIETDDHWIENLYEQAINFLCKQEELNWLLDDISRFKDSSIDSPNVVVSKKERTLIKLGGLGLVTSLVSPERWVNMENAIRQIVIEESQRTSKLLTFSTLSTSRSEITDVFAMPTFENEIENTHIEFIESSRVQEHRSKYGRKLRVWITKSIILVIFVFANAVPTRYASPT